MAKKLWTAKRVKEESPEFEIQFSEIQPNGKLRAMAFICDRKNRKAVVAYRMSDDSPTYEIAFSVIANALNKGIVVNV